MKDKQPVLVKNKNGSVGIKMPDGVVHVLSLSDIAGLKLGTQSVKGLVRYYENKLKKETK